MAQAQAAGRPTASKYPVYHPDGHMEMHPREIINDLIRHGTWCETGSVLPDGKPERVQLPWTLTDPTMANKRIAARAAVLANAQSKAAAAPQPGVRASALNPLAPQQDEALAVLPRLDALRKAVSDAGVAPDPTWGVARLEAVLSAAQAGAPLPKDPDDDE